MESVTLAVAGGIAALFVARSSIAVLLALTPPALLGLADVSIDRWILLYTFGITLIIGVVLGLAPAMPLVRDQLTDYLRDGGRSVTSSVRARRVLIVGPGRNDGCSVVRCRTARENVPGPHTQSRWSECGQCPDMASRFAVGSIQHRTAGGVLPSGARETAGRLREWSPPARRETFR
jgi:hypothetical protein